MNQGKFITIEGPDGAGKTSVIQQLSRALSQQSVNVMVTREPGGVDIAEQIREVILNVDNTAMDSRTEALLYAAARRQHLVEKVVPALQRGQFVLCDRFVHSSLAYQGVARGIDTANIWAINAFAIDQYMPDLTLVIDVPAEIGLQRIFDAREVADVNRLDKENLVFHQKVRNAYLEMATQSDKMVVVDGTQPLEQVVLDCLEILTQYKRGGKR